VIEVQVAVRFDAHVDSMPEVGAVIWPFSDTTTAIVSAAPEMLSLLRRQR
jgi:hypothetical protein